MSDRDRLAGFGHKSGVLWFTGLSASGKSTIAERLEWELSNGGYHVCVLDGDRVRRHLSADLDFSAEGRAEHNRRVGEVATLIAGAGLIVITALISPCRVHREQARRIIGDGFHEVFLDADLDVCERRDPKGLYRLARKGEIADFTGVSAPYEPPTDPDYLVPSGIEPVEVCVSGLIAYVEKHFGKPPSGR